LYPDYEEETLELAKSLRVPVLSIALTSSAQTPFLDRLARETSGRVVSAESATDLLDAYLSIFSQIKDRTVLAASPDDPSFFLDPGLTPYISSMSFILSRTAKNPVLLYSPAGRSVKPNSQNVDFYLEDPRFVAINLSNPMPGKWSFQRSANGEFKVYAILHSRLRIKMDAPGIFHQQSKPMLIAVQMTEETADGSHVPIIGDATFTAVVTLPDGTQESLDLFYDDGTHGDTVEEDGIFSRLYMNTEQIGIYTIQIHGHKGDVLVDYLHTVEVIPFPKMILQEPVGTHKFDGEPLQVRVLLEDRGDFSLESGELIAVIRSPSGLLSEVPLVKERNFYSASFVPPQEGIYQIEIAGRETVYRGLPFEESISSPFEVKFVRTLTIEAGEWVANGCFDARGYIPVQLHMFSPDPAIVEFSLSDARGLQLNPASIKSIGGSRQFTLHMTTPSGMLSPGIYQFRLEPEGSVEFEQKPMPANFSFQVPNVYQRCGHAFRWGGLSGFVLLITVFFITRKIRLDAMPALITGTLRYWRESSTPSLAQESNLTLLSNTTIVVGSAIDCDLQISDHGLADRHFTLVAEKTEDGTQVLLKPLGAMRKGYSELHASVVLRHSDTFRINDLIFQYLSDSGE
jgi:hypothetical protein